MLVVYEFLKTIQSRHVSENFIIFSWEMLMSSSIFSMLFILLNHSVLEGIISEHQWVGIHCSAALIMNIASDFM